MSIFGSACEERRQQCYGVSLIFFMNSFRLFKYIRNIYQEVHVGSDVDPAGEI
jgi:hypothetical protein